MTNVSPLDYLHQQGILSTLECKERADQTTMDLLISLRAQANDEHVTTAFFDVEMHII